MKLGAIFKRGANLLKLRKYTVHQLKPAHYSPHYQVHVHPNLNYLNLSPHSIISDP